MAEVLGAIASVLQLLESSIKALGIIQELRDAPVSIKSLCIQVQQLRDVVQSIQSDSEIQTPIITNILHECMEDLQKLQVKLNRVTLGPKDKFVIRSWKAFMMVMREVETRSTCERIEAYKTTLLLAIQNKTNSKIGILGSNMKSNGLQIQQIDANTQSIHTRMIAMQDDQSKSLSLIKNDMDGNMRNIINHMNTHHDVLVRSTRDILTHVSSETSSLTTKDNLDAAVQKLGLEMKKQFGALTTLVENNSINDWRVSQSRPTEQGSNSSITGDSLAKIGISEQPFVEAHCSCFLRKPFISWGSYQTYMGFKVIQACFVASYGMDGVNLGHNLRVYNVVKGELPALKPFICSVTNELQVHEAIDQLRQLFLDGKASPNDVYRGGQTFLHAMFTHHSLCFGESLQEKLELLRFLIICGLDINSVNSFGNSPLMTSYTYAFDGIYGPESLELGSAIAKSGGVCIGKMLSTHFPLGHMELLVRAMRDDEELAEDVLHCGPLSLAVLQRSELLVRKLSKDQTRRHERNFLGHTPLHLCGDWTHGPQILLQAGCSFSVLDDNGFTPLHFALAFDNLEATALFVKVGGPFVGFRTKDSDLWKVDTAWLFRQPSFKLLITEVKEQRERLVMLAEEFLLADQMIKLKRRGSPLAFTRAHATWKALKEVRVPLHPRLNTNRVSFYHLQINLPMMHDLHRQGFTDVDEYDCRGRTPLMLALITKESEIGKKVEWLLANGANSLKPLQNQNLNALHLLAMNDAAQKVYRCSNLNDQSCNGGRLLHWMAPADVRAVRYTLQTHPFMSSLMQQISPTLHDSCGCACSLSGFTPTTKLLATALLQCQENKRLGHNPHQVLRSGDGLYRAATLLYSWYMATARVGVSLHRIRQDVRRYLAFEALGLTPTCCHLSRLEGFPKIQLHPEEYITQTREAKKEHLQTLDDLTEGEYLHSLGPCNTRTLYTDVILENPAPTLKWANLATINTAFGLNLDEDACEEIRLRGHLTKDKFWHSSWVVSGENPSSRCDNEGKGSSDRDVKKKLPQAFLKLKKIVFRLW